MARPLVLVLGGTGVFGRRIAANLAKRKELDLVIAGRDGASAAAYVRVLGADRAASLVVDLKKADAVVRLLAPKPAVIVDTVGPFQTRNLALPRRCAERGVHYVDIADARSRVAEIASLDSMARVENVAIVSGASTVPAISTAIVDELAPNPREVVAIDVGISPGQRTPRGLATARSILSYCGRPVPVLGDGDPAYGWGELDRHCIRRPWASAGSRTWTRPSARSGARATRRSKARRFRAGLEISLLHLGLALLSRGVRLGVLPSLTHFAPPFLRIAAAFDWLGSDAGAMHVRVQTRDAHARSMTREAVLVAEDGDGPQIPAAPAALVVKKLLGLPGYAPLEKRGAFPCIGILTREEIMAELRDFAIRYIPPRERAQDK